MPAKNRIKTYVSDSYYHVYNRGVDKRTIFQDKQDYNVFLSYLKTYLLVKDINYLESILSDDSADWDEKDKARKELDLNNFYGLIDISAFCLMSNHFHFLLKQKGHSDMDIFMNSICTRYSMYFNRKYDRVGPLFQGVYKAVLVSDDEQLSYLSRYIHRNPMSVLPKDKKLVDFSYSSYPIFVSDKKNELINSLPILELFNNDKEAYKDFIENDLKLEPGLKEYYANHLYIE